MSLSVQFNALKRSVLKRDKKLAHFEAIALVFRRLVIVHMVGSQWNVTPYYKETKWKERGIRSI